MDVNRRFFMAVMAGAGMDPERLLWVPGRKMISIAAPLDVVSVETLFGMPGLMPFDVPLNERVRALLAIDPSARFMAEGSGTVRFTENRPALTPAAYYLKYHQAGSERIVIPGRDINSPGAYKLS